MILEVYSRIYVISLRGFEAFFKIKIMPGYIVIYIKYIQRSANNYTS